MFFQHTLLINKHIFVNKHICVMMNNICVEEKSLPNVCEQTKIKNSRYNLHDDGTLWIKSDVKSHRSSLMEEEVVTL